MLLCLDWTSDLLQCPSVLILWNIGGETVPRSPDKFYVKLKTDDVRAGYFRDRMLLSYRTLLHWLYSCWVWQFFSRLVIYSWSLTFTLFVSVVSGLTTRLFSLLSSYTSSLSFLHVLNFVTLYLTLGWKVQTLVSYIITFVVKQLSNYMLSSTALRFASDTPVPFCLFVQVSVLSMNRLLRCSLQVLSPCG